MNYQEEKKIIKNKLNFMHDNLRDRDFLKSNGCYCQKEITERKTTDMRVIRKLIYDLKIINRKMELQDESSAIFGL